jgi:hypothetical protein
MFLRKGTAGGYYGKILNMFLRKGAAGGFFGKTISDLCSLRKVPSGETMINPNLLYLL